MKYIAKPSIHNNVGLKEFDNAKDAVLYLNDLLTPKEGDQDRLEYVFVAPSINARDPMVASRKLRKAVEEYSTWELVSYLLYKSNNHANSS